MISFNMYKFRTTDNKIFCVFNVFNNNILGFFNSRDEASNYCNSLNLSYIRSNKIKNIINNL